MLLWNYTKLTYAYVLMVMSIANSLTEKADICYIHLVVLLHILIGIKGEERHSLDSLTISIKFYKVLDGKTNWKEMHMLYKYWM